MKPEHLYAKQEVKKLIAYIRTRYNDACGATVGEGRWVFSIDFSFHYKGTRHRIEKIVEVLDDGGFQNVDTAILELYEFVDEVASPLINDKILLLCT